jgi:hypothetical protein
MGEEPEIRSRTIPGGSGAAVDELGFGEQGFGELGFGEQGVRP